MFSSFLGFGKGNSKETANGTGYGGQHGDKKRLVAGVKKAAKESSKDDACSTAFLEQIQKQLKYQRSVSAGDVFDLDEGNKTKVTSLLADTFRSACPADWDKRRELYATALEVCRTLSSNERLGTVFGDKEGVLFWLLEFRDQAEQIKKHHADSKSKSVKKNAKVDRDDMLLATQVIEVAEVALKISRRCQASKPEVELSVVTLTERYQSQLGPLRFNSVDSMENHFYLTRIPNASPALNTRNLFKELAAYRTALPIEYGSSCFCRVINSRLDLLRVMITGPDETPYANGCFFFDINLPTAYPKVSPKVQFLTTGGGRIRFNPNLYNCGKVCLSLLGTWSGPGWISGQSTLLQVLISIQSLILVPDPYFNEPGWERDRGTARGTTQSKAYNHQVRKHTIAAAIEAHLSSILGSRNEYIEFESVMTKHFLEKSNLIQKELWSWVKDDKSLAKSVTNVCCLLDQLAKRERGAARSKRPRRVSAKARKGAQPKPIVLDDSDVEEDYTYQSKKLPSGAMKSNETIEIDLSEDEEEKKVECTKKSSGTGGGDLIDLTF